MGLVNKVKDRPAHELQPTSRNESEKKILSVWTIKYD
jgi:hypothetical protein